MAVNNFNKAEYVGASNSFEKRLSVRLRIMCLWVRVSLQSNHLLQLKEKNRITNVCNSDEERKSTLVLILCSILLNDDFFFLVNETDDNDLDNT